MTVDLNEKEDSVEKREKKVKDDLRGRSDLREKGGAFDLRESNDQSETAEKREFKGKGDHKDFPDLNDQSDQLDQEVGICSSLKICPDLPILIKQEAISEYIALVKLII